MHIILFWFKSVPNFRYIYIFHSFIFWCSTSLVNMIHKVYIRDEGFHFVSENKSRTGAETPAPWVLWTSSVDKGYSYWSSWAIYVVMDGSVRELCSADFNVGTTSSQTVVTKIILEWIKTMMVYIANIFVVNTYKEKIS